MAQSIAVCISASWVMGGGGVPAAGGAGGGAAAPELEAPRAAARANAGSGASFGPDTMIRNPYEATLLRNSWNSSPAFEQAPLPQAMIGRRFAPLKGLRSAGR